MPTPRKIYKGALGAVFGIILMPYYENKAGSHPGCMKSDPPLPAPDTLKSDALPQPGTQTTDTSLSGHGLRQTACTLLTFPPPAFLRAHVRSAGLAKLKRHLHSSKKLKTKFKQKKT